MHFEHSSRLSDRQTYTDAQTCIASVADQRRFWSKPRSIFNSHSNVSLCFPTSNMFVARARARSPSRNMWIKFCAASKFYVTYFQLRRTLNAMHLNEYNILFNSKVEVFRSRIVCLFTTTICVWFFVLILFSSFPICNQNSCLSPLNVSAADSTVIYKLSKLSMLLLCKIVCRWLENWMFEG